jgi:hypothetical protein
MGNCQPSLRLRYEHRTDDDHHSLTQATDTIGLQLLFKAMKETILQNALNDSEIV